MFFLRKLFSKEPSGIVTTIEMDKKLGNKKSVDMTELLQNQVKDGRLEIKNEAGKVILRIPDPKRFPEVWPELQEK